MRRAIGFLCCLIVVSCFPVYRDNDNLAEIYKQKGFNASMKRLKPEIVRNKTEIVELASLNIKDAFATMNADGEFCLARMDRTGNIELEALVPGFPRKAGKFYADGEANVLWTVVGRGFYAIDIATRKTGHIIVSHDGNDGIQSTFLADAERKIFFIKVVQYRFENSLHYYILYDLLKDEIIFKSSPYQGMHLPFPGKRLLFCEYVKAKAGTTLKWQLWDLEANTLPENKLVKELTRFQISIWPMTKTMHLGRQLALGTSRVDNTLIYYSVRWDSELEKIKVEPLLLQKPKDMSINTAFAFSADGNWVRTTGKYKTERGLFGKTPELIIYHVSEIYPQAISLPIFCGYTEEKMPGAFMEHSAWGPCYLEANLKQPDKLFVYKLNDGLKILAEEAKSGIDR